MWANRECEGFETRVVPEESLGEACALKTASPPVVNIMVDTPYFTGWFNALSANYHIDRTF